MDEKHEGVTVEYKDDFPIITVDTDLRGDDLDKFKNSFRDAVDNYKRIVVVVGENNFLYDEFIGISVSGLKNAQRQGVKIALVCAPQHQYDMLEVIRLTKVFDVFRSLEEAVVFLTDEKGEK